MRDCRRCSLTTSPRSSPSRGTTPNIGSVFFDAVQGFTAACCQLHVAWWVVGGFLLCAASTAFLPDRERVHEHARARAELLESVAP